MKRFARRVTYIGIVLLWLVIMTLPALAFVLATQGQIRIGSSSHSGLRVYLLQDFNLQGIGIEWSRPLREEPQCAQTSVNYLILEGDGAELSAEYCYCYEVDTDFRRACP